MQEGTAEPPGSALLDPPLPSVFDLTEQPRRVQPPRAPRPRTPSGALGSLRRAVAPQITEAARPSATLRRDRLFRRGLAGADLLALLLALLVTTLLFPGGPRLSAGVLMAMAGLLASAKLLGLYDRDEAVIHKTTLEEAPRLFHLATLCTLLVWIADRSILSGPLARGRALVLWIALTGLLIGARALMRAVVLRFVPVERCLFVGEGPRASTVRAKLADRCGTKAKIVAQLSLRQAALWSTDVFGSGSAGVSGSGPAGVSGSGPAEVSGSGPADVFGSERLGEIRRLVRTLDIHRAILAPGSADGEDMLDLVCALKAVGVRVSVLPRLLEVVGSSVEFDDLHGMTIMGLRRFSLTRSTALVKRAFDVAGASLLLLIGAPLMIAIAIAIKLDSPGPVFFRQKRVGRNGAHFSMLKFRTMVRDAERLRESLIDRNEAQLGLFKIAADPRITRVGRTLRRSSLDELPQLLNVLRGEMSLVGPRPLVVEEDMCVEGRHRRRLELHPGMTGHWQILGPARVPLREMAAIDCLYVANWSLWTDVKILLRTIPHVLERRGL